MEEKTTMEITNDRLEEAIKDYAADRTKEKLTALAPQALHWRLQGWVVLASSALLYSRTKWAFVTPTSR